MEIENEKKYKISLSELGKQLGIKEKIIFVNHNIFDNSVTITVTPNTIKPFPIWVRWVDVTNGYDVIQWADDENTIKGIGGFVKYTVKSYTELANRLDEDFTIEESVIESIKAHDRHKKEIEKYE